MRMKTSFKEELRKSLLNNAMVPFICAVLLIITAFMVIGFHIISQKNETARTQYAKQYTETMDVYTEEINQISKRLSLADFQNEENYKIQELEKIYHFLNNQKIRGEFYIYDKDFQLVYKMNEDDVREEYIFHHLKLSKKSEKFWNKTEFIYDDWDLKREIPVFSITFRKLVTDKGVEGYVGFAFSSDVFEKNQQEHNPTIILTNKFHRIVSSYSLSFSDERGKLIRNFKNGGLSYEDGHWYYVTSGKIMNDEMHIYSVSDCTVFLQLILSSVLTVLIMSIFMIIFIYDRAGEIAKEKTDIMYELIDALKEVENENLDIRVNIKSSDEFEKMGNTFNQMLDSIQELMESQRQLIEENTIATIQSLESQFNPHFLFNILESIRYMIEIDKKTAEKMIVSLSRLLRYSIQRTENMVTLGDEISFADKYLQVMMCRFGERLNYHIDVDKSLHDIIMPRMIIQPIIENSIKYGYGDKKILDICITARKKEDKVELVIQDNGEGIETKLLQGIRESLNYNQNYSGHIGIHNVHRRLHLMYGEIYGLNIESENNLGTSVTLTIPANRDMGGK